MPLCLHYVPRKTGLSFESTPSHASLFAENIGLNSVEASLFSEWCWCVEKGCGVYLVYKDEGRSHLS